MPARNDPRAIIAWAMYDWANSAYVTTTATALLPAYFAASIMPPGGVVLLGRRYDGQTLWAYVLGASALVVLIVAPVLGAIADFSATKKRFLQVFTCGGALAATSLAFVRAGDVVQTLSLFFVAQIGFVGAVAFYDAFLPELTTPDTIDRVSATGYAYGYFGGGVQLALAIALVTGHAHLGIGRDLSVRLSLAMAGLWWLGFAAFALSRLDESGERRLLPPEYVRLPAPLAYASVGLGRMRTGARELRRRPALLRFLLAYVLYTNGVESVIGLASVYAVDTLGLDTTTVLVVFLAVQFVAVAGSLAFAACAAWIGARTALLATLGLWTVLVVAAYFLEQGAVAGFCALGAGLGFIQGGTQSLARSLYGSMIPEGASAQLYGVFSAFSRLSAVLGPLVFAAVSDATGSARTAILSLIVFFIAGGTLLASVDVERARAERAGWCL